ncbi:DUF6213 family protein [Streptomyces sp. NPDC126499]|uniref:DUF6213 family protein n=1 Tax=Streptomyces sp. NPDC126499 TaxID=3155314 RepID=UPI00331785BA
MNAPTSFIVLADGHLLVPADQMTGLLRRVAAGWLQATDQGYEEHDPATVLALATGLMEIADQIDAECIGLMPLTEGQEGQTGADLDGRGADGADGGDVAGGDAGGRADGAVAGDVDGAGTDGEEPEESEQSADEEPEARPGD